MSDRQPAGASSESTGDAERLALSGDAERLALSDETERLALSDETVRDALPADLDAAGYVGPYLFPNNNRRRVPGVLYLATAAVCVGAFGLTSGGEPVLVNAGFLLAAAILAVVGAFSLVAGWNLDVDERDALVVATSTVGFPVGHASAQLGWRGLLSRPTWRILLYSDEDPPATRGLVLVDGIGGKVVEWFTEANPEDWSDLAPELLGPGGATDDGTSQSG